MLHLLPNFQIEFLCILRAIIFLAFPKRPSATKRKRSSSRLQSQLDGYQDEEREDKDQPPIRISSKALGKATLDIVRAEIVGIHRGKETIPGPPAGDGDQEADDDRTGLGVGLKYTTSVLVGFNIGEKASVNRWDSQELDIGPHDGETKAKVAKRECTIVTHFVVFAEQSPYEEPH